MTSSTLGCSLRCRRLSSSGDVLGRRGLHALQRRARVVRQRSDELGAHIAAHRRGWRGHANFRSGGRRRRRRRRRRWRGRRRRRWRRRRRRRRWRRSTTRHGWQSWLLRPVGSWDRWRLRRPRRRGRRRSEAAEQLRLRLGEERGLARRCRLEGCWLPGSGTTRRLATSTAAAPSSATAAGRGGARLGRGGQRCGGGGGGGGGRQLDGRRHGLVVGQAADALEQHLVEAQRGRAGGLGQGWG